MQKCMRKLYLPVLFLICAAGMITLSQSSCVARNEKAPQVLKRHLIPPFDVASIRAEKSVKTSKKFKCRAAPLPIRDLHFNSMYDQDSENASIVDPEELKKYKKATKDIHDLETGLGRNANAYLLSKTADPAITRCVVNWLNLWASEEALLGESNRMGEFVRKWALSSIALSYLQVRDNPELPKEDKESVERWIRLLAERVVEDFSKNPKITSRRNNHMYWAGWGVITAAVVLDDKKLFDWGIESARIGISQIQKDGTLPLELARGPKAYNYHHYAAIPLMMTASLAQKNGVDLFKENDKALKRLARVLIENLENQEYFENLTGEKQNLERTITSSNLSWLEPYYNDSGDPEALKWLEKFRPVKHSRVGGDATLLYGSKE
ncbi:MAG: alginate lyase family protein [Alphaproteobacteria bacterium]